MGQSCRWFLHGLAKNAPNEDWRKVTFIPITENGQQKYIRNLMDDVVKLFPPSAVVYRRKPPLLVITDMKFNINMLANHGFKINDREINICIEKYYTGRRSYLG